MATIPTFLNINLALKLQHERQNAFPEGMLAFNLVLCIPSKDFNKIKHKFTSAAAAAGVKTLIRPF